MFHDQRSENHAQQTAAEERCDSVPAKPVVLEPKAEDVLVEPETETYERIVANHAIYYYPIVTVVAVVMFQSKVLLLQRPDGLWQFPEREVAAGEDGFDATPNTVEPYFQNEAFEIQAMQSVGVVGDTLNYRVIMRAQVKGQLQAPSPAGKNLTPFWRDINDLQKIKIEEMVIAHQAVFLELQLGEPAHFDEAFNAMSITPMEVTDPTKLREIKEQAREHHLRRIQENKLLTLSGALGIVKLYEVDVFQGVVVIERRPVVIEGSPARSWSGPGGFAEPGENPVAATLREIKEEIGLDAIPVRFARMSYKPNRSIPPPGV